ncbi:MAG: EthD domain-containing protein [Pseudomonadota bacterium]|nr:EthD domain-containing protein [Pseudomonadota bacterium]
MEKIVYQVWKQDSDSLEEFKNFLLIDLPNTLKSSVTELQINIADDDVSDASGLIQSNYSPSPNAIIFLKIPSFYFFENDFLDFFQKVKKIEGFIVSESIVLEDEKKNKLGERTEGFSQIVFLEKPENMNKHEWFEHWTHYHTKIAIETQSNFIYVQNTIVRPLQNTSENFIAIIEECFPHDAMSDPAVFYNAANNPDLLLKNTQIMMDSCTKFIDFTKIEVIPTSRYRII